MYRWKMNIFGDKINQDFANIHKHDRVDPKRYWQLLNS